MAGSATTKGKVGRPTQNSIQTVRIPFLGNPTNRDTVTSKDQRFINCYFDILESTEGVKSYYLVKRPGYSVLNQPPAGAAVGRGLKSWKGNLYSVFGTKIYKGTTDLGVTLTTSSGFCGIEEVHPNATTQRICINDGVKLFVINTADVVTTVTTIPANLSDLVYLDRYFFVMQTDGTIAQCDVDDPTTWNASKVIVPNVTNGVGRGLAKLGIYIVAFTSRGYQSFYDAANTSGSVLTAIPEGSGAVGCAAQSSIAYEEDRIVWVSDSATGGYSVAEMRSISTPRTISTPGIDRILRAEGTSISSAVGNLIRIAGHLFYVLKLAGQSRTLVYDITAELWYEWQNTSSSTFDLVSFAQHNNTLVGQHVSDGRIHTLSESTYQDNGSNFTVFGRFRPMDFDDEKYKFMRSAELVGDRQTTSTPVSLQYSDDDFQTLSTARTLDVGYEGPRGMNLGRFKRRSWQMSYAGSNPLRLESLQLRFRLGTV